MLIHLRYEASLAQVYAGTAFILYAVLYNGGYYATIWGLCMPYLRLCTPVWRYFAGIWDQSEESDFNKNCLGESSVYIDIGISSVNHGLW